MGARRLVAIVLQDLQRTGSDLATLFRSPCMSVTCSGKTEVYSVGAFFRPLSVYDFRLLAFFKMATHISGDRPRLAVHLEAGFDGVESR